MVCSVFPRRTLQQPKTPQFQSQLGCRWCPALSLRAWLGQQVALLNWVDLRALGSLCVTQAGTVCTAAAWAPVRSLRDLGHCLTSFPWVVMEFSNLELTHQSLCVGRIVLTLLSPLEMMENIWSFSASGQELLIGLWCLVICTLRPGTIPN